MKEQPLLIVVNGLPIVAMFQFARKADFNWYAIVFEKPANDFEDESKRYGTAMWKAGQRQWDNGNYGLTYQDAIVDAMDRAGVTK